MRIKKIEIDGFKSYAQRVVVDGFDKTFNAITGLNGSGKSNILDSICFVLGITNLSQVRAQQLSDLVYKQGQAGITKATVTITFDNTDPNSRPVGYDKYSEIIVRRQIIINGRNTYTINGTTATNARVADLFRSVGLNVNNPHFLIMQGRITKVLNMKPVEILSMIEEAAGVRMYESKKQSSLRTIEKKEGKVHEIKKLMDEDILPKVEKLKRDRNNYLEYQKIGRDIDNLKRKLLAFDYANSQAQAEKYTKLTTEKENELELISREIQDTGRRIEQLKEEYDQMEKQKATKFGNEKAQLEQTVKELQKKQTDVESRRDAKKDANKSLKTNVDRKTKSLNSDKKELEKKRKELEKMESENGGQEKRGKDAEEKLQKARSKMEALAKGMTTDEDGNAVTLEGQLTNSRSALSVLETNVKKAEMKLKQLVPLLGKKKKELGGMATQATSEEKEKKQLEATIARIEADLKKMNFDEEAQLELEQERRSLINEQRQIQGQIDDFENRNHNLQFRYKDPYQNFDKSKVKGLVAKLFRVKDMRYATALEVAAGGGRV
uniref:RecF/RecN/SMC N-terminal domain-containing protein n=1 Tax=Acrobeloides nanus TaxID=290746 RepID=A0A914BXX7_9BILA